MILRARSLFLYLCVGLVLTGQAAAQEWRVESQTTAQSLGHGAWQVQKTLSGPAKAELHLVCFDAARCRLQVVDAVGKGGAATLRDAATAHRGLAACNGGFFTQDFQPLGLMVSQGVRTGTFERSSLLGGALQVKGGRHSLIWRDEFKNVEGVTDFLQTGPRLVNGGASIKGLENKQRRPRTFILTDQAGHWGIGVCRYVTLAELSALLVSSGVITEMKVQRALNLDGGRSTGFWWKDAAGVEHSQKEVVKVRNFLVLTPRR